MDIRGKVAVVTGGGKGIGKAVATALYKAGCKVAVADINGADAAEVGSACGGFGVRVDVTNEAEIANFLTKVELEIGPVDIVVSNAGIAASDGPTFGVAGAPNAAWEKSWQVNVMASVYLSRHSIPGMVERGGGVFIVVASAAGLLNQFGATPYTCTKHAAVSFAESLAITHVGDGIQVHCVCPQGVQTDLIRGAEASLKAAGAIIQPEDVGLKVIEAIETGQRYVFTHEETQPFFQARASDPEGWLQRMIDMRALMKTSVGKQM